jgi:hypothetical protein
LAAASLAQIGCERQPLSRTGLLGAAQFDSIAPTVTEQLAA